MLLTKSTRKSKKFFRKSLRNLTSFFLEGYQKLPTLNPFTSCSSRRRDHHQDQFCSDFPNGWDADLEKETEENTMLAKEMMMKEENGSRKKQEVGGVKKQKTKGSYLEGYSRVPSSRSINAGSYGLAHKMKELDMMDETDMEHVLDIEEALHYYSRLRSPVYLDIVDNFFMDMYSEFNVPQPSVSVNSSKRRKGSFRF